MREIVLDASSWSRPEDIYDSFLQAVGAPQWHGHNFNALRDSICVGRINKIEVPYLIRLKNYYAMGEGAKGVGSDFVEFIKELRESGCPVDIVVEN